MKTKFARLMSSAVLAMFLGSVMLVFVPTAAAQGQSTVAIEVRVKTEPDIGTERRLAPESELGKIVWEVKLSFGPVPAGCISSWQLNYEPVGKLAYQSIVISPTSHSGNVGTSGPVYAPAQDTAPQTRDVSMTIAVAREAPAFKDEEYKLKATLTLPASTNGCGLAAGAPATGGTFVKTDYLPLTTVNPGVYFQKAGQNKKVIFPVDIQNIGNGPSRVRIEVIPLGKNRLDSIIPPAELRLESRAQKGSTALFKAPTRIEAQTPHSNGYTNSIYSFQARFLTSYDGAGENTATDETAVTLSVQVQGVYVPGFDSVAMLGALGMALAGVALLRRKRN